jgi:hypothetical protein
MDEGSGTSGRPRADLALFALLGLTLDSLGSSLVWLDGAAFARYCRVIDGSGCAAGIQIVICLGPATWLLMQDSLRLRFDARLVTWHRRGSLALDALALTQVIGYVSLLRLPWLLERAAAHNRLDLWSARLSETQNGVPLVAFLLAIGFCTLFVATSVVTLRALRAAGFAQNPRLAANFTTSVWGLCTFNCALTMVTLITFATGGLF